MAISVAALDVWHGASCSVETVSRPQLSQIHDLFGTMDGKTRGILTIETDLPNRRGVTVGGGPDLFLCFVSNLDSDTDIWNLRGKFPPNQTFKLWTGGQEGDFGGHYLTGRDIVLRALDYFFMHEDRDPDLPWFEQLPDNY